MTSDEIKINNYCGNCLITLDDNFMINLANPFSFKITDGYLNKNEALLLLQLLDYYYIKMQNIYEKLGKLIDSLDFDSLLVVELLNSERLLKLVLPYINKTLVRYINAIHLFSHTKICELYYQKPELFIKNVSKDLYIIYKFKYNNVYLIECNNIIQDPISSLCISVKLNFLDAIKYFYKMSQQNENNTNNSNNSIYCKSNEKTNYQIFPIISLEHDDSVLTDYLIENLKGFATKDYLNYLMKISYDKNKMNIVKLLSEKYQIPVNYDIIRFCKNRSNDQINDQMNLINK